MGFAKACFQTAVLLSPWGWLSFCSVSPVVLGSVKEWTAFFTYFSYGNNNKEGESENVVYIFIVI